METADHILAQFDQLIAKLVDESLRDEYEADPQVVTDDAPENAGIVASEAAPVADPAGDSAGEALVEAKVASLTRSSTTPQVGPATETVTKPVTKTTAKLVTKPTAKPTAKPVTRPVSKPVSKPTAKAATKRAVSRSARSEPVLEVRGLAKRFGDTVAVDGIDLTVETGTIFGIVGPNGAGKTTTLSMVTGLLRPDAGTVIVHGANVWDDPAAAKRQMGVLPDRLRLFDRLTGSQLLYYAGILRGLPAATVKERMTQLSASFGLDSALGRLVSDYSAGMTKKLSLAAAMIHSPRILVLDEPFESVDPVSSGKVVAILERYVEAGGTVVLSSHSMDLIERVCDSVAVIVNGQVLASGTVDDVRGAGTLEQRFIELAGGSAEVEGLEWLHNFSG